MVSTGLGRWNCAPPCPCPAYRGCAAASVGGASCCTAPRLVASSATYWMPTVSSSSRTGLQTTAAWLTSDAASTGTAEVRGERIILAYNGSGAGAVATEPAACPTTLCSSSPSVPFQLKTCCSDRHLDLVGQPWAVVHVKHPLSQRGRQLGDSRTHRSAPVGDTTYYAADPTSIAADRPSGADPDSHSCCEGLSFAS